MRSTSLIFFILVVFSACKVQKPPATQTDEASKNNPIASSEITADDTFKITIIDSAILQDSVNIGMKRVLRDTVSIIGVGDIMMGTNFPNTSYLPVNNGNMLFSDVSSVLMDADITFGNLEGVILNEGGTQKNCNNPAVCYLFRTPESYVENLVSAGFDIMSSANNHAGDFGNEGRNNTVRILDSVGILNAGFLSKPYITFRKGGVNYGFAAFSPNSGTASINDIPRAIEIVQHLDSISDIVMVSFHGGAEGSKYQNVTRETETFYGENRGNVYTFSHTLIDAGADVIFGHGPHVTRAIEVYNNRFIAYSLGNFCTYARFNLKGDNGIAPIIKVNTNGQGEFINAKITPIIQYHPGAPKIDSQKRVIQKIIALTKKDFPEAAISIDPSGIITYIQN